MKIETTERYIAFGKEFTRLPDVKRETQDRLGAVVQILCDTLSPRQRITIWENLQLEETRTKLLELLNVTFVTEENLHGEVRKNIFDL